MVDQKVKTRLSSMPRNARRVAWIATALASMLLTAFVAEGSARNAPTVIRDKGRRQQLVTPAAAVFSRRAHYVGEVWASFVNDGHWGSNHSAESCPDDEQLLRISWCPSFEFPGGSRIDYLFSGGLWIGGIVGADTLVSLGYEGWDETGDEFNGFTRMATELPPDYTTGCGAWGMDRTLEQTYYCVYSDTALTPQTSDSHVPMGLEVTQVTHQSSDNFARSFIIVDLQIRNIGPNTIKDMYLGVFNDCDVYWVLKGGGQVNANDDISGFLATWPNPVDSKYQDTLDVAWSADNDGDVEGGSYPTVAPRGAMGWRILRKPEGTQLSYNWWTSDNVALQDWGPRRATDLRQLGHGGRGTPSGDRNKYHYMSNGEIDYGQLFAGLNFTSQGWAAPPGGAVPCNLADGLDTRSLLTVGPVEWFAPGDVVPLTFALIGGKNIHRYPDNSFDCQRPDQYVAALDFSDLAKNAWWAGFVFDNYGVDTDGDGYAGEFYKPVTDFDTAFYTGDGCPDFNGPSAPSGPDSVNLHLVSRPNQLEVHWTGINSELKVDPLLRLRDFEGYKLYYAERNSPIDRPTSDDYSLQASWDIVNWRRYTYDSRANSWDVSSQPLTLEQWRDAFADNPCADPGKPFDPGDYSVPSLSRAYCYREKDRFGQWITRWAYFEPQDFNQGDTITIGDSTFANLIQRVEVRDTIIGNDTLQYGVYLAVLKDLLPSRHYFISVTAFDFGDPFNDLEPLETTPGVSRVDGIPIYSADVVDEYWNEGGAMRDSVRVIVYPNPYKASFIGPNGDRTSYAEQKFEGAYGQDVNEITDEARRIHFINVPADARIRIYSLDGDLIRELKHPDKNLTSYSSKISWDLISRNTQAVESGIYIYRVDSHLGAQIGKIVIIK